MWNKNLNISSDSYVKKNKKHLENTSALNLIPQLRALEDKRDLLASSFNNLKQKLNNSEINIREYNSIIALKNNSYLEEQTLKALNQKISAIKDKLRHHKQTNKPAVIIAFAIIGLVLLLVIFQQANITGLFSYQEKQLQVMPIEKNFTQDSVMHINISKLDSLQLSGILSYEDNFSFEVVLITDKGNFTIANEKSINSLLEQQIIKPNLLTGLVIDEENEAINIFDNPTQNIIHDISENITENLTSETNDSENLSLNITNINISDNITNISQDISTNLTVNVSDNITSNITTNIFTNTTQNITQNITENISENISLNITETNISQNITINVSDNITQNISLDTTENITTNFTNISINQTQINITTNITTELNQLSLENICKDTCSLKEVNAFAIIVKVKNAELYLDKITYTTLEENNPPVQIREFDNISILINDSLTYDLNEYFNDEDNDELLYDFKEVANFNISLNQSIVNISFNNTGEFDYYFYASDPESLVQSNVFKINVVSVVNQTNVTIDEVVSPVVINEPVKLLRKVKLANSQIDLKVKLPEKATNIKVNKIVNNVSTDISDNVSVTNDIARDKIRSNLLTGKVTLEKQEESNNETEIIIGEEVQEIEVEYDLPGPESKEEEINEYKKQIIVSSDIHYENILAYSFIENTPESTINLYWYDYTDVNWPSEAEKKKVDFDAYDTDEDGLVDYIEWIVPHLSNQTYEIAIVVLNPYSYLKDGDTWYVRFNTTGTANLTIWSNNSYWEELQTDINTTIAEMRFINISCGNNSLQNELIVIDENNNSYNYSAIQENDSIKPAKFLILNYNCDNATGQFVNYMNIAGYATLIFEFANQNASVVDYAYDPYDCPGYSDRNYCWIMGDINQDCNTVCNNAGSSCVDDDWNDDENCTILEALGNKCETCEQGPETYYPGYIFDGGGYCYIRGEERDCSASEKNTARACACNITDFEYTSITNCTNINESGTYYLINDIINSSTSYCMNISANNVVLDCQGNTIDGNDVADYGIYVSRVASTNTSIIIRNCTVTDWDTAGVYLYKSDSNTLEDLNFSSNPTNGAYLYYSDNNALINGYVDHNINGMYVYYSNNNTFTNNNVDYNTNGIYLSNSKNNNLTNNYVDYNNYGIRLSSSNNNNLTNNYVDYNYIGIRLISSNNNTLINNSAQNDGYGIYLLSSSSNEMNGNLLEKNERSLYDDSQNDYSDNQFIDDSISKILNVSLNKQLFNLNDLIEFNISVYYPNGTACSSFTTNISTRPHEIISSSTTQNNISGNFTATKQGMYSLIINVTDNFNNSVKRKYMFYVDADSTKTVNYYLRPDVGPIHGQPTENDARSLLFEAPTNESYFFCGTWVQASPDNVNINFPVCLKDINISSWYKVGGTPLMGVERYVIYDYGVDENQSIPTAVEYEWIKVNFTNLNWSLDYITDWYWLSVKLKGDLIYWYTNATHPSYVNISYLYTDTPEIMNISNENAQILSATMASGSSDALIQLDGTSSTNITVQMPDSDLFYAAEYDGTDCGNTNDCNFTQSNGLLEFSLALGSEHNLTISQGTPEENKFEIKDPNGITVASIDSVGNMFIKGTLAQCTGVDSVPTQNSFIIENNAGTPVVYINSSGYAFIVGSLYQHSIMTLTGSNLEIRDNTNSLVAFIDSSGNIKLSGQIVENYDNP